MVKHAMSLLKPSELNFSITSPQQFHIDRQGSLLLPVRQGITDDMFGVPHAMRVYGPEPA